MQFIQEGRGRWIVNGEEFEAGAGDILVIKAGPIHSIRTIEGPLVQLEIHLSPGSFRTTSAEDGARLGGSEAADRSISRFGSAQELTA